MTRTEAAKAWPQIKGTVMSKDSNVFTGICINLSDYSTWAGALGDARLISTCFNTPIGIAEDGHVSLVVLPQSIRVGSCLDQEGGEGAAHGE